MKSDKYEPRKCEICGRMYKPGKKDQRTCGSKECQAERRRLYMLEWKRQNYGLACERNREQMRKRRSKEKPKEDTIIGLGYAERQIAETLKMVGRVDPRL